MFTHLTDLHKGIVFFAIVFSLVLGLTFAPLDGQTMLLAAMFMPTVATLAMLLVVTRDGYSRAGWASLGLHRPGFSGWPLAILAPLLVLGISFSLVWSSGLATFSPPDGLDAMGWVTGIGAGMVQNVVFVALTFALVEEIGWRGYLLPKLALAVGVVRGMALTGLMHGLFHVPLILLTPFYHPDGNRLIVLPLFLASLTIAGLLYGYIRITTNSVWPASLAHSAHNYFWALFGSLTVAASPAAVEYLAGETGLLPMLGYGLLAAWLLRRRFGHRAAGTAQTLRPAAAQTAT